MCFSFPRTYTLDMVTLQYKPQLSFIHGPFLFLLLFTAQTERVTAQIWRPNIDKSIDDYTSDMFVYNGNKFPKFRKWPGNLFVNYSFIQVGQSGLSSVRIPTSIQLYIIIINSLIKRNRKCAG